MLQPQPDHELRPRLPVRGVAAEDECGRGEAGQHLQPRPLPARLPRGLQDRAANEPKQSFTVLTKPPSVMIFWDKCPAVSHLLTVFKRTFSLYLNRFLIVKALEGLVRALHCEAPLTALLQEVEAAAGHGLHEPRDRGDHRAPGGLPGLQPLRPGRGHGRHDGQPRLPLVQSRPGRVAGGDQG